MEPMNVATGDQDSGWATGTEQERFVAQVAGLVSPPEVYLRAFELVESPDSSAAEIAEVISCDPNLTARLLGLVNSCYYNLARQVDTVSRAIAVIGTRELYSLVIAASAVSSFSRIPNRLVSMDTFWKHSIHTALAARALARRCHVLHPERLFVSGLLHDIGSLVLYHQVPDMCSEHLLVAAGDEEVLYEAERETFGFTHADLGARLALDWRLPAVLAEAIGCHHDPENAREARQEASLIHVADRLANCTAEGNFAAVVPGAGAAAGEPPMADGLDARMLDEVAAEVAEQFPVALRALAG